jgi:hypothetical protein
MTRSTGNSAVSLHRERKKRQGLVRVEVQVRKEDAPLLRSVADALTDPARASETRILLRQRFTRSTTKSLKALLADAPLDGIDLERSRDPGRDVEL